MNTQKKMLKIKIVAKLELKTAKKKGTKMILKSKYQKKEIFLLANFSTKHLANFHNFFLGLLFFRWFFAL